MAQAGFPSRFCLGFFTAPNQHRLFRAWLGKRRHLAPSPFPVRCSHIHSKTACRGFKSFCPCQKSQVSLLRYLTFSLVCGRIWQRGAPAGPPAVRVVGRWSPVATVQRRPRRQPRQVLLPLPKSQVSLLRYLTFSLVCGRIWQRGAPAGPPAVRVVGRWSPVATVQRRPRRQPRPSPSAPATKPAKTLGFRRFAFCTCCMGVECILVRTPGFLIWFDPFSTVLILSSTRNAPGFALFGRFRVRFAVFALF